MRLVMNIAARSTALLSLALLASSCTETEVTSELGDVELRCPYCCQTCTNNSPRVNDYGIPEINLAGLENADGVTLQGILSPDDDLFVLDVVDDAFVARDGQGAIVANQLGVIGWKIRVRLPGNVFREVKIFGMDRTISSWASNGTPMTGYALGYFDPGLNDWVNVCPEDQDPEAVSVTLIAGETYDSELKLVTGGMLDWVTIACEGQAVYKMKRMNYGPNQDFDGDGNPATEAQRQATLKMITADYCGDGNSHTAQGTPIHWRNFYESVDSFPYEQSPAPTIEALWGHEGAVCLTDPRLEATDPHPELLGCDLPLCEEVEGLVEYEWMTWTPTP
jgi:hypothetical protein